MSDQDLKKTALNDWHRARDAKMVGFAGYELPVTYPLGLRGEHEACRSAAALFDVSHMGQVSVTGPGAVAYLESILPLNCADLALGKQAYSFLLNADGGVLDDLMCARLGDTLDDTRFELVVNGACKAADLAHMQAQATGFDVSLQVRERALIALQGPRAAEALAQTDLKAATDLKFMEVCEPLPGYGVSRSGYTGEDGFEIALPNADVAAICDQLCGHDFVEPAGLGARDSLRLEAGLCLYGQDLDTSITPLDASLGWAVPKNRSGYLGAEKLAAQRAGSPDYALIGLLPEGRAPWRAGVKLFDGEGQEVGLVTSGTFSPTLDRPIALARVQRAAAKADQFIGELRGKRVPCQRTKLPFVKKSYAK